MNIWSVLFILLFCVLYICFVNGGTVWDACPSACSCKWVAGRKAATCKNKGLTQIPDSLSIEIQTIDLSGNALEKLPKDAFNSINLTNLMKINLQGSQIREVHVDAFKGLGNVFELDLSENRIYTLEPGTFDTNIRLKTLILNKNPIVKIPGNLFNLNQLTKLELSDCELKYIADNAFEHLTNLTDLRLEENLLTHVSVETFRKLTKLNNFYLYDNPWVCDCKLRPLRNWMIEKNLLTEPTECVKPDRLKNKYWKHIEPYDFACKPEILWPPPGKSIIPENSVVELSCLATGDPLPSVQWIHNSRIISEDTLIKYNANRYTVTSSLVGNDYNPSLTSKWVNLTIHDVNLLDKGQYKCSADSPGGNDELYIALLLDSDVKSGVEVAGYNIESWPLIIGLSTGLISLLIILILIVCCFCSRYKQKSNKNNSNVNNSGSDKQDESLLAVNPIQKPPRRETTQVSPDEGVELSELNTKLLDENSLNGTVCSASDRSNEFLSKIPENQDSYPPDLLAFSSRRFFNASPGGSAKNFDYGRPLLSPGVHSLQHRYNFGTLPYSRSHSPLAASGAANSNGLPVITHRPGYVTIPRRPRVPSWSSAPTPSLLDDPLLSPGTTEPVYDNLGPRTTADGSSVLSLNKTPLEPPTSIRKLQKTPQGQRPFYFHYESPCPSPLVAPETDLKKWEEIRKSAAAAGGGSKPTNSEIPPPVKKVGPKPPPKPKKKDGPLFEDEGEDGTEV